MAGASQQLRNMASTGGNLLQRTRCLYFYDTATPCNKREPGSGCSAIGGHQPHARDPRHQRRLHRDAPLRHVRGAGRAGGARSTSAGPAGERVIAFADFHRLPGDTPQRDTNLDADEIITAVELPPQGFAGELHLSEDPRPPVLCVRACVRRGRARDSTAAPSRRRASRSAASRTSRGAIAQAEAALQRAACRSRATFARAADMVLRDAKGFGHNTFKIDLARRAIVRALTQAARGTPQSQSNKKIA